MRPAGLALIGTTSLYGERPSQYDRIAVPVEHRAESEERRAGRASGGLRPPLALGGKCVRYEYLGRTLGLGTFHFGDRTVKELALLLAQSHRGQQVNSVFGEGVNPRLRKLRDGLNVASPGPSPEGRGGTDGLGNPSYGRGGRGWCMGRRWWRTCGSI